jgi:hypothetical protein
MFICKYTKFPVQLFTYLEYLTRAFPEINITRSGMVVCFKIDNRLGINFVV